MCRDHSITMGVEQRFKDTFVPSGAVHWANQNARRLSSKLCKAEMEAPCASVIWPGIDDDTAW